MRHKLAFVVLRTVVIDREPEMSAVARAVFLSFAVSPLFSEIVFGICAALGQARHQSITIIRLRRITRNIGETRCAFRSKRSLAFAYEHLAFRRENNKNTRLDVKVCIHPSTAGSR